MTLKELARQYHYKELTGNNKLCYCCKSQLVINFLSELTEDELWNGAFAKAERSFEVYLAHFRKQDILKEKGIDPKKHKEYRLTRKPL